MLLTLIPIFPMGEPGCPATTVPGQCVCVARDEWPQRMTEKTMRSQCGQDAFIEHNFFGVNAKGIYLDLGCNDGISNSNTFHFLNRGWKGKCFEADPNKYLSIHSASGRLDGVHGAASSTDGRAEFAVVRVPDGGLSGLSTTIDERARKFGVKGTVSVPTFSPQTILTKYYSESTHSTLDYVSIDVEGHELEVLRSWPFGSAEDVSSGNSWCVNMFTIENNHWCNNTRGILPELRRLMPLYEHVRSIGPDELFVRRERCPIVHHESHMPEDGGWWRNTTRDLKSAYKRKHLQAPSRGMNVQMRPNPRTGTMERVPNGNDGRHIQSFAEMVASPACLRTLNAWCNAPSNGCKDSRSSNQTLHARLEKLPQGACAAGYSHRMGDECNLWGCYPSTTPAQAASSGGLFSWLRSGEAVKGKVGCRTSRTHQSLVREAMLRCKRQYVSDGIKAPSAAAVMKAKSSVRFYASQARKAG